MTLKTKGIYKPYSIINKMTLMKKLHVLLVEDNQGDIVITREALNETHSIRKISVATDGDEAIHFLENLNNSKEADFPDIIFMDTYLQKMDGYDVLKYIKTTHFLRHIPVIISTDSSYQNDINNAYLNMANAFVIKSGEVDVYINHISKTIEYWTTIATLPSVNKAVSY